MLRNAVFTDQDAYFFCNSANLSESRTTILHLNRSQMNELRQSEIKHYSIAHEWGESTSNTFSVGRQVYFDSSYLYLFPNENYWSWKSPNSGDPRLSMLNPQNLIKVEVNNLDTFQLVRMEADSFYFSAETYDELVFLEKQGQFLSFGSMIHQRHVPILSENPRVGFKHVHPAWFMFDTDGNIIDYDSIGSESMHILAQYSHYLPEENKVYIAGHQLDKANFPVSLTHNALIGVFDLNSRKFDYVHRISTDPNTRLGLTNVLWEGDTAYFDGTIAHRAPYARDSTLRFGRSYSHVNGYFSLNGDLVYEEYKQRDDQDIRFLSNQILHVDSDSSYLMCRSSVFDPETYEALDAEHLWLLRMDKNGGVLDTIKIAHDFISFRDQYIDGTHVDTSRNELWLWGSYLPTHDDIPWIIIPAPYLPYVYKLDYQAIIDMTTALKEEQSTQLSYTDGISIYPTVFDDHISLYNELQESRDLQLFLYNSAGQLVHESQHQLVSKQMTFLEGLGNLSTGTYHYILKEDGKVHNGSLVKR